MQAGAPSVALRAYGRDDEAYELSPLFPQLPSSRAERSGSERADPGPSSSGLDAKTDPSGCNPRRVRCMAGQQRRDLSGWVPALRRFAPTAGMTKLMSCPRFSPNFRHPGRSARAASAQTRDPAAQVLTLRTDPSGCNPSQGTMHRWAAASRPERLGPGSTALRAYGRDDEAYELSLLFPQLPSSRAERSRCERGDPGPSRSDLDAAIRAFAC